ncbi:MAG: hypothetical protein CO183_01200 [Candidatus Zambryskibacteria bacterium CG_4_9_14_3_um_filter_42_9]|uniref:Uncharacterized protein n=1 Tax=Candidatus Zambryskibacteria bacterium CG22_combo_CG10-13_8_21_14_all_42_17 TaxID=1975118 RepID=A0A2H0BEC5_9BACT|nr:MAG: hypothetical protein COX06_00525 [Candidatus Zambryskibacteria bacterium CG22_combo_CG10-13_8_21_14_all_42_17]PJA36866.1 MAG: hypothetical protein CO183_01200 [Candidatus Zambryskibacteria bacterium CG_4_9_14_3_um_filter_42_9]
MKSDALVFLTINNKNGERNLLSVIIVNALKDHGCTSVVLESANDKTLKIDNALVVPLFDKKFGVNRWSPCSKKASGIPDWVRELSTGSCVAIGPKCVQYPSHIEDATQQIANMFLRELCKNGNGNGFPWGLAPSSEKHKRRSWRRMKYVRR